MTLSDICDQVRLQVDPADRPSDGCVGLAQVSSSRFSMTGSASDSRSAKYAFRPGDVLYGKLRPYLDKAVIATREGMCTTEFLVLRPRNGISGRYLVAALHAPSFIQHAISGSTGTTHPRTSWNHVGNFVLPSYSSSIRDAITEFVWKVERAIVANQKLIRSGLHMMAEAIDVVLASGLQSNNQSRNTPIGPIPVNWQIATLGELCTNTALVDVKNDSDRIIEYVDVSSICRESLQIAQTRRYRLGDAPGRARKQILAGDVILATVRPTLMNAAVVPLALNDQVCSTAFCVLRGDATAVANRFIYYVIQRRQFVRQLGLLETGASYPAVTDHIVREQMVPVPPLSVQQEIVRVLDTIRGRIELHREKASVLERIRRGVLHVIFATGEVDSNHAAWKEALVSGVDSACLRDQQRPTAGEHQDDLPGGHQDNPQRDAATSR